MFPSRSSCNSPNHPGMQPDANSVQWYSLLMQTDVTCLMFCGLVVGWHWQGSMLATIGIFSAPNTIREAGWVSLAVLGFFAVVCCYTGVLLKYCFDSKDDVKTFPDIGEAVFGRIGRLLISIVLYAELYSFCVEFIILEGDNMASIFTSTTFDWNGIHAYGRHFFGVVLALVVLPSVWLRYLRVIYILPFSGWCVCNSSGFPVCWFRWCYWQRRVTYGRESSEVGWYTICNRYLCFLLCWALGVSKYLPDNVRPHKIQQSTLHMVIIPFTKYPYTMQFSLQSSEA